VAIEAVRVAPGDFFLASEQVAVGLEFSTGDTTYRVVGEPVHVGPGAVLARVELVDGPAAGHRLNAYLRTGQRQS